MSVISPYRCYNVLNRDGNVREENSGTEIFSPYLYVVNMQCDIYSSNLQSYMRVNLEQFAT